MKIFLAIVAILVITFLILGNTAWHLHRNQYNQLPKGVLQHEQGDFYKDETGTMWELQPAIKNKFHQPSQPVEDIANPYPNVSKKIEMDAKNPNLKFLSVQEKNTSYEAILQPNGTYLTSGKKQGTYNYAHPNGIWGMVKHTFLDVLPHFVNSNYK